MKQQLNKIEKRLKLPISVEEEYYFNNQMFQISEVKDNYFQTKVDVVQETFVEENESKEPDETENNIETSSNEEPVILREYELFSFESENPILSKNKFKVDDQIRVMFDDTNTLENVKINLNGVDYDLRTINNEETFVLGSIPTKRFIILQYNYETIEKDIVHVVEEDDGEGGTIPKEEIEKVEETIYFFTMRYVENLNCNVLENNYNTYYHMIISSVRDFEKKYSRNVLDTDYRFCIDSITDGDILLPAVDIRSIEKVCYLTLQEKQSDSEPVPEPIPDETQPEPEPTEKEYEVVEKEIDPRYFTVSKVGDYDEQRLVQISSEFKIPEDILADGSPESEMPYIFYFSVGYKDNIFPKDLKLAFMNDVQFKLMNRGSDIVVITDRTAYTTDFVKNVFKNYKYMRI